MSRLTLVRYCYSENETEGRLYLNDDEYVRTLERPWRAGSKGGLPFKSCVPDGEYNLIPHTRGNGDKVFALWNPALGVYYTDEEKGTNEGRYMILIHSGNFVRDVVGCIAPGVDRIIYNNAPMVTNSKKAMTRIMSAEYDVIDIQATAGAAQ